MLYKVSNLFAILYIFIYFLILTLYENNKYIIYFFPFFLELNLEMLKFQMVNFK